VSEDSESLDGALLQQEQLFPGLARTDKHVASFYLQNPAIF